MLRGGRLVTYVSAVSREMAVLTETARHPTRDLHQAGRVARVVDGTGGRPCFRMRHPVGDLDVQDVLDLVQRTSRLRMSTAVVLQSPDATEASRSWTLPLGLHRGALTRSLIIITRLPCLQATSQQHADTDRNTYGECEPHLYATTRLRISYCEIVTSEAFVSVKFVCA